ncbi:Fanconi anaemia protein FANCD2 [Phycomyces nitens]|nr:Fanconi anaemia protein FANCD2 [Phycomyces nitens]
MSIMIFVEILQKAGCVLDTNRSLVTFQVEPILFRRQLGRILRSHANYPDIVDEFVESMETVTEDVDIFRRCLLPLTVSEQVPRSSRATSNSDSLFKTLLAVDIVQPKIITHLLERLPEFYSELENDNSSSCTPRLILHQLRWLDYIVEPEVLTDKLIEIIDITPPIIQHEIITSLPDIINDSEHKPIVVYLKELMMTNTVLTVPILDALSNLTLHSESLDDVRQVVLERLDSAELDDLPVIVKFLLQTVSPTTVDTVITGIRQKLDFRALGKVQQTDISNYPMSQKSKPQKEDSNKNSPEALILESIKLGLQFHKFVCDGWIKAISGLAGPREHKVIDVLILFTLHSMPSTKKKAESIFKKKILSGAITGSLLEETILCHANGLTSYWNTILSLTEFVLRSNQKSTAVSQCAGALYASAFKSCDAYYRQEIVGLLVTHIGSGEIVEMNVALNVFLKLVKSDARSMAVYAVFIKGILDYLDNLSLSQIRTLFDIFSVLALTVEDHCGGRDSSLWSDIQIVIRKQLSNPREKYKKIGIIACLSAIEVLGSKELCSEAATGSSTQGASDSYTSEQALRHPVLKQAIDLIDMVLRHCDKYPLCLTLVYDELAYTVRSGRLDRRFELWIRDNLTNVFLDNYVMDVVEATQKVESAQSNHDIAFKPELWMNLDNEEAPVAINFYDLIHGIEESKKRSLMIPLCSIFNLMQSCEKQITNGNLDEVDALLGCGVILFQVDDIDDMLRELHPEEFEEACNLLFYAVDWYRELVKAFSTLEDMETRQKLVLRLKNIITLESVLEKLLKHVPNFVPLEFHVFSSATDTRDGTKAHVLNSPATQNSQAIKSDSTTQDSSQFEVFKVPFKKDAGTRAYLPQFETISDLRRYMRALDVNVLRLLKPVDGSEESKLDYKESNYLLKDLNQKLDIKLGPTGKKKLNEDKFPTTNAILMEKMDAPHFMTEVIHYLPLILQTLENLYEDAQLQENEPGRVEEGGKEIALSIRLCVNVLSKLFLWPDLENIENSYILQSLVSCLADRISEKPTKGNALNSIIQDAFTYLSRFVDNMLEARPSVDLCKVLVRMMGLSSDPSSMKAGALAATRHVLTTNWFDRMTIKKDILFLVEQSIQLSDDPIKVMYEYMTFVLPTYERDSCDEKDQIHEDYPLLRPDTALYYYQAVLNQTVKNLQYPPTSGMEFEDMVNYYSRIVKLFERTTNNIKIKSQRELFIHLLKTGRVFIKLFTAICIPFFTNVFKSYRETILSTFKDFQTSTRILQTICSHVKAVKDNNLASYVPALKMVLENVLYQVKILLNENNVPSDAFVLGALKHRDIRGAEVSSQLPRDEISEEEEEIEEDEDEAEEGEDEAEDDEDEEETSNAPQGPAMKRRLEAKNAYQKSRMADALDSIRTTSQIPDSSDEEDLLVSSEETSEDESETPLSHHQKSVTKSPAHDKPTLSEPPKKKGRFSKDHREAGGRDKVFSLTRLKSDSEEE